MGENNGPGRPKITRNSAPVCWDCKDRIDLNNPWRRFAPEVVAPPAGVHVCGPKCRKTPLEEKVFLIEELGLRLEFDLASL